MEKIMLAAVRAGNHIITGKDHAECLRIAQEAGFDKPDQKFGQGFLTDRWRFVLRNEALIIAMNAGQIQKKHAPTDKLLSEDLKPQN